MKFRHFMKTRPINQQEWSDGFYKWLLENRKLGNRSKDFWIDAWNDYCDFRHEGINQGLNLIPEKRII